VLPWFAPERERPFDHAAEMSVLVALALPSGSDGSA
jgi:hypothetical protein